MLNQYPEVSAKLAAFMSYAMASSLFLGMLDFLDDHSRAFGVLIGFGTFVLQWRAGSVSAREEGKEKKPSPARYERMLAAGRFVRRWLARDKH